MTAKPTVRPRPVRSAASEPVLREAEILASVRHVSPHEIAARSAAKAEEASQKRTAEAQRSRRNRLIAWGLYVLGVLALAVLGGLMLNRWVQL